jgi:hypothetical protein
MNKVHVSFYQEVQEILKKFENVNSSSRPFRISCVQLIWKKREYSDPDFDNMDDLASFM